MEVSDSLYLGGVPASLRDASLKQWQLRSGTSFNGKKDLTTTSPRTYAVPGGIPSFADSYISYQTSFQSMSSKQLNISPSSLQVVTSLCT